MDLPSSNHQDDAVFFDALDHRPSFYDTVEDSPEPSSTTSDPQPVSTRPRNSHSQLRSSATTIRRRSIRHGSPDKKPEELGLGLPIDGAKTSFRNLRNSRTFKEDENSAEKRDSNLVQQDTEFPTSSVVNVENNEESTVTTAANDDAAGDSADSALQIGHSSSSFLDFISGLVIKAIGFQMKLIVMFVTSPIFFVSRFYMFCIDPFGTTRRGKVLVIRTLRRVLVCISPCVKRWFRENGSFWSIVLRWGWGFLWSIYVCCILIGLLVSSFVFSGFLMKCLVEKPIQMKEVLNFDYTKYSPVAYVPIISCAGVIGENYENNNIGTGKWVGERAIPPKHKVQVIVSLRVPESEYNRKLGIFQVRVDFLLSNGKPISSSSQPCILKFRSEPIRLIMTFLKIAPLVTGYISETQTLNVRMRGFVEGDLPTSCLKVTLEQRAEYQPGAGIPEIYDASVVIETELPFFKRIIWLWKMSMFIWITMAAFVMQLLFVLVCCRPIIIPRTRQRVASAGSPVT